MKKKRTIHGFSGLWTKLFLVMRLSIFLFFAFVFVAQGETFSQSSKLTLDLTKAKLIDVLNEIEEQSDYYFYFNIDLDNYQVNQVEVNDQDVKKVLNMILPELGLGYEIVDRYIVIKHVDEIEKGYAASQQQIDVSGKVTDSSGSPLLGVTVVIKGTTKGVITDIDGSYSLPDVPSDAALVFSFVGMKTQEIHVAGKITINIVMQEETIGIEEVVAIGYGTSRKEDLTGSISSIKLEQSPLATLPNVNILDVLKGSMPGFNIGAVTEAGSNPSMQIRGRNSISASNTPLIVVDGVIYIGSMNEINPMDIASVDVLKDASSTAIYGSLAANGVILITTKRGKTDKPTVQMNMAGGFQTYTNSPDMLRSEGYIQLRKDRFLADNPGATYDVNSNLAIYELEAYNANHTVDWFDVVTRHGVFQNYGVSVSGSTPRSNYYFSGNYMDQQGIVIGDDFKKFTVMSKIESQITDWLKVGLTLNIINKNADGIAADLEKGTINGPYAYLHVHDRGESYPGYGDLTHWLERYPQGQTTTFNPLWKTQEYNEDRNQNYRGSTFAKISVPWIKGLNYTLNYSLNRWEGHNANFQDEIMFLNTMNLNELIDPSLHLVDANGYVRNQRRTDWYMNHLVGYKRTAGDHSIDATLMAERQGWKRHDAEMWTKDFSKTGTTVLGPNAMELGNPANYRIDTDFRELFQLAYMARLNYVYRGRYYISGSIRRDGYSGYAEGHKYGMFRSGAIAWTASDEPFVKDHLQFLNTLKFRLSLGENGNPSVGEYATFPSIANTDILIGGTTSKGVFANKLANKSLDWEKTTALNLGIDFSVLNNTLGGSIDLYNSNTTNLLLARAIPIFNGFTEVLDNIGKVNNKGIEIQVNSNNMIQGDFQWKSSLNFWLNRNKVVSLYGLDVDGDGKEDDDIANSRFIGKPLDANYTYVMEGIIQIEDIEYMAIYGGQPGDIKFKDLNRDGEIDADHDRKIVGYNGVPNFTMTLGNTLKYKNFELYFLINYIAGGGNDNYYIGNNLYAYYPNALYGGTAGNWLDKGYWTPENPSKSVTRTNYNNSAYGYNFPKTRDFVRLQDVSLSFDFPAILLRNTPIAALKAYASGKNLLTFSSWEGLDPESGTTFGGVSSFPVFKIYTFGLNVTF